MPPSTDPEVCTYFRRRRATLRLRALAMTADELQNDLAPVRPIAMLGEIDALPGAERKRAVDHRYMQRYSGYHCLNVRRHVVRPFDCVHPAGSGRCDAVERRHQIGPHIGIGVLLDDERRRGMAQKERKDALLRPGLGDEADGLTGEFNEPQTVGLDNERGSCEEVGAHAGDRRPPGDAAPARDPAGLPESHGCFVMSLWVATIISTIRLQTFSMKVMTRFSSASLGS